MNKIFIIRLVRSYMFFEAVIVKKSIVDVKNHLINFKKEYLEAYENAEVYSLFGRNSECLRKVCAKFKLFYSEDHDELLDIRDMLDDDFETILKEFEIVLVCDTDLEEGVKDSVYLKY